MLQLHTSTEFQNGLGYSAASSILLSYFASASVLHNSSGTKFVVDRALNSPLCIFA